ncbi:HNH endonuclease [Rhodococcus sp. CSLK01-03]|uniref:HNH endonuclease n=2 Tax=Rhodococcus indonesiensis TaxID=3055869 RepID=A0ABT7RM57_9NOCA|nr:HNH endonuclease [Rhodococcus indonesiensis]
MAWSSGGRGRTSTPAHRRWRRAVLARDDYRCVQCGHQGRPGDGSVEADHVVNVAEGGLDDVVNGQTLCVDCHKTKTQREAAQARALKSRKRPAPRHPGLL